MSVTSYTVEQLSEREDLVAIFDGVYDLKKLAANHPGGDLILACGGQCQTALFHSMHPYSWSRNTKVLEERYRVGTLSDSPDMNLCFDSEFAVEVKKAIQRDMQGRPRTAPAAWWLRTALIACLTVTLEYLWATSGRIAFAVSAGVLHAMIGISVQHDASHGAVSKGPLLNSLFSYGADWIGNNKWLWMQQHVIGHHPNTNVEGEDPDAHSAEPLLHFHPSVNTNPLQWLFMWLVLPFYGPTVVYNAAQVYTMKHNSRLPNNVHTRSRRFLAVLARLFYVLRIVVAPMYLAGSAFLPSLLAVPLSAGLVLTFLFVLSHNFEGSNRDPLSTCTMEDGRVDWYKLQAETAATYGGFLSGLLTGGLNYQIEHHLVPNHNSMYYPQLQANVRKVCAKHGVNYTYFPTIVHNIISCIRYMASTGAVSKPEPLFIILKGKRVDVTRWARLHPGGDEILRIFSERDATEQFETMHSDGAKRQLDNMLKSAKLAQPAVVNAKASNARTQALIADFTKLRQEFVDAGMFKAPVLLEIFKFATLLSYFVVGVALLKTGWHWVGALVYGLGMQQTGWLAHDYLHHSVTRSIAAGDLLGSALGWLQGYDSEWWKWRHNIHHVATNEEENDPDVDIAPILTYFKSDIDLNEIQKLQHIYFVPLLSLLHFSWVVSSFRYVWSRGLNLRIGLLLAHFAWFAYLFTPSNSGNFLFAQMIYVMFFKGIFTALFVFSTHYPEDRLGEEAAEMSLVEQTCRTSRNIHGWGVNWFSGNISLQIEHHLFATMPRANYPKIRGRVKEFCLKWELPYSSVSLYQCMKDNVEVLRWPLTEKATKVE